MRKLNNIHPGEILENEFLQPLKISQNQIARNLGVSPRRINEIVHKKRSITADTSIRLAKYFDLSDGFFLGLQKDFDLEESKNEISNKINAIKPYNTNQLKTL